MDQFSYHTAERFYLGIPDRYVAGGRWIEFKRVTWAGARAVSPIRQFSGPQIKTLDKFTAAGDETWVAVVFQTAGHDLRSCFMPWAVFRKLKPQWKPADVIDNSMPWDGTSEQLRGQIERAGFNASR